MEFAGDKKELVHFLVPYEKKFIAAALPHVPLPIGTVQLTLMTILWSVGIIFAGYRAQADMSWLWMFSGCIFLQYVTDMLDGAVGRSRNTGLIKWGFYMDHFLDYVFLSSIVIGYSFLLPVSYSLLSMLCLMLSAGFMVHTIMDFSITNHFKISFSYFGVSEARMLLIVFNTILIVTGPGLLLHTFPFFVGALFIALGVTVYRSQITYAHLDAVHQSMESMNTSPKLETKALTMKEGSKEAFNRIDRRLKVR
ncbi:MAG: CDP-alcohol phosphatidyltransferase family protein [Candidatus Omnitrophica bacterium]|nr:CDP-alcohol phosphatidyltransferase family protein [Candidatus Omnitrophota bacterium]